MIDRILKAARKLAASHEIVTMATPPQPDAEQLAGAQGQKQTRRLIHTEVEVFEELVQLVGDYFNAGRSSTHCRACRAPVIWAKTPGGKNAPLDACPVVGLDANGEQRRIYLSHFATCPAAKEFGGTSGNGSSSGQ